jgi:methenyltetrahydromethanopterin cyclohydrolase
MTDATTSPHPTAPFADATLSVNREVGSRVERLLDEADRLRVAVRKDASGACIVDAGIEAPGSLEAGVLIGEICMGGLGRVQLTAQGPGDPGSGWPTATACGRFWKSSGANSTRPPPPGASTAAVNRRCLC